MQLISLRSGRGRATALLTNGNARGIWEDESNFPGSLLDLIKQEPPERKAALNRLSDSDDIDLNGMTFLPPIEKPGKIICVGLNYADHTDESPYEQPDYPTIFPRFTSGLIGHDNPMVRPRVSDTLDFEGELAVVIGREGRHISVDSALDHVAGYSIFNDGSVREYQFKSPQWTIGKNFDGTGAFGPGFVFADELPWGAKGLKIETRLNGETVQSSNTDNMIFDVATIISTVSEAITLEVGDVIAAGTPSGIGFARDPKLYMKPGDVCEVEIESIGLLRNRIIDEEIQD